jgi:hypothetical protein
MSKQAINIPASVKARLQNMAREKGRPFAEVLQYYGMERFLYRFSRIPASGKFILKGALMFTVWELPERRATLDIDMLAKFDNGIPRIEKIVRDACKARVEDDGMVFNPKTLKGYAIKEEADYSGVRIKFTGFLERSRVPMQLDFGFGDRVYPEPEWIEYPVMLDFPAPKMKGYTAESVIAEKFEAMIKLGELNSRMKDFYDVWLIITRQSPDKEKLAKAILATFKNRHVQLPGYGRLFAGEIYDAGSDRQVLWKAFLNKNSIKHAREKLKETAEEIEKFIKSALKEA